VGAAVAKHACTSSLVELSDEARRAKAEGVIHRIVMD
jgi:hypothetical protein